LGAFHGFSLYLAVRAEPLEIASAMIRKLFIYLAVTAARGQQYVAVAAGLAALFLLCRQITAF
jgi:hypothetical protein